VLFVGAGLLAERFALVEDPQCLLSQRDLVVGGGGAVDVALGEPLEHPDPVHARPGVKEQADERGDGQVPGRVAQLAVLAGGADQALLLPVPQHPRGHSDSLGEPRYRHQLVAVALRICHGCWLPP
jgi:hypothetical protein